MVVGAEGGAGVVGAEFFHDRFHGRVRAGRAAHVAEGVARALHDLEIDLVADLSGRLGLARVPDLFETGDLELDVLLRIGSVDPGEGVAFQDQAAGAFPSTNPSDVLFDLVYALRAGYRQNAGFVMNRRTQSAIRKFKDAQGNYLWHPPLTAGFLFVGPLRPGASASVSFPASPFAGHIS